MSARKLFAAAALALMAAPAAVFADPATLICRSIEFPAADPTVIDLDATQNRVSIPGATVSAVVIDARTINFHTVNQARDEQRDYSIDRLTGKMSARITSSHTSAVALWHYDCDAAKPKF